MGMGDLCFAGEWIEYNDAQRTGSSGCNMYGLHNTFSVSDLTVHPENEDTTSESFPPK